MTIRVVGTTLIGTAAERAAIDPEQFRAMFYETDTELIYASNLAGNAWVDIEGGLYESYYKAWDQKAQNTHGGGFTLGAWRTRDFTQETDPDGIGALAGNQITLDAGTYRVIGSAPALDVSNHVTRLQNVTDALTIIEGSNSRAVAVGDTMTRSWISGRFTIAGSKALELQHQSAATKAVNGFGTAMNYQVEIYSFIEFFKEA